MALVMWVPFFMCVAASALVTQLVAFFYHHLEDWWVLGPLAVAITALLIAILAEADRHQQRRTDDQFYQALVSDLSQRLNHSSP